MQQSKVFIAGNQVCMKRGLDTVRLQRYFEANHCERVSTPEDADILIALTCAFIDSYVQTATAMIESLKQHPGRLWLPARHESK
jgi:tRNA A37 methylthiotransferase MiaB